MESETAAGNPLAVDFGGRQIADEKSGLSKRRLAQPTASRLDVVVSKSGEIMKSTHDESDPVPLLESNQMLVEVTKEKTRYKFFLSHHKFVHR